MMIQDLLIMLTVTILGNLLLMDYSKRMNTRIKSIYINFVE